MNIRAENYVLILKSSLQALFCEIGPNLVTHFGKTVEIGICLPLSRRIFSSTPASTVMFSLIVILEIKIL